MKEKEVNLTASQKISSKLNDFIGRHAKLLVAIAALVIVLIIVLAVALTMMQSASEKKFNDLLDLEAQYSSLSLMSSDDVEVSEGFGYSFAVYVVCHVVRRFLDSRAGVAHGYSCACPAQY